MIKVALVTGAARRVGRAIALALHEAGFSLALHYHQSENEAKLLLEECNAKRKGSACLIQGNLHTEKDIQSIAKSVATTFGRLDILVNNASVFYKTDINTFDETTFNDLFDVNLIAPMKLAQYCKAMLKKNKGKIINITDVHTRTPLKRYGIYTLTKTSLAMLTKIFAVEWAPDITAYNVAPGIVEPPEGDNAVPKEKLDSILNEQIPLRRLGTANDIANAVCFLATHSTYMTGETITIDGGRSLNVG